MWLADRAGAVCNDVMKGPHPGDGVRALLFVRGVLGVREQERVGCPILGSRLHSA